MSFKATSDKINVEEVRSLSQLTGDAGQKLAIVSWKQSLKEKMTACF